MAQRIHERAARLLIASLLESDLSERDLRQIADAFEFDHAYATSLGRICRQIADGLPNDRRRPNEMGPGRREWHERATEVAKRKRRRKRDIVRAIHALVPSVSEDEIDDNRTVSENLRVVDHLGSEAEKENVLSWLESGADWNDEYLDGIMRDR